MRRRWCLIQVDIESTLEINPSFASNSPYWCVFLAHHPDDHTKSDELCRWWPDWYRYTTCRKTKDIIYGTRVLIRPCSIPCATKFVPWETLLWVYQNHCNILPMVLNLPRRKRNDPNLRCNKETILLPGSTNTFAYLILVLQNNNKSQATYNIIHKNIFLEIG